MNVNKGTSVLVVDDCEDNRLLMELLLQSEGYKVKSVDSGIKGLAEINKQHPDLIILDLMMPDISGLEVVRHLKDRCHQSRIPIILLTANSQIRHHNVRDVDVVCHKPFNLDNILEKIHSLVALQVAT